MKVMPAPLSIEETEQIVRYACLPGEQRWLLIFETEQEANDVMNFLRAQMPYLYNEDGSLKS